MQKDETAIKVRYVETDQMGVVHHSNYFAWFELSRGEFFSNRGLPYSQIEEQGVFLPVLECSCKYLAGSHYEDRLIVVTKVLKLTPVKIEFSFEIMGEEKREKLAFGYTKHAFVDTDFKIINLSKKKPELWKNLQLVCCHGE